MDASRSPLPVDAEIVVSGAVVNALDRLRRDTPRVRLSLPLPNATDGTSRLSKFVKQIIEPHFKLMRLCLGGDYQAMHGCTRADAEAVNLPRVALPDDLQLVAPVNIKAQARLPQPLAQPNDLVERPATLTVPRKDAAHGGSRTAPTRC